MASDHSSRPQQPPAWQEAPETPPARTGDPLGTAPRLPQDGPPGGDATRPASVPGNRSWQQMFGADASGAQGGGGARRPAPSHENTAARPSAPPPAENGGWDAPSSGTPASAFAPAWVDSRPGWTPPPGTDSRPDWTPAPTGDSRPGWNPPAADSSPDLTPPHGTDSRPGWNPPAADSRPGWNPPAADPRPDWTPPPGTGPGPSASADPFAKPDPFASADPFAKPDPFASADPFARTAAFGAPAGGSAPVGDPARTGPGGHPGPGRPGDPGQVTQPGRLPHPGGPGPQPGHPGQGPAQDRAGGHLSRDPSDPNRPFVTAGQISGPKTPPPERQQELWNTVFGDNYQAMGEEEDLAGQGRPVWVFALAGSAAIALVGAALWAFLAGPLAATDDGSAAAATRPSATPKPSTAPKKVPRLPRFQGEPSPVAGTLTDTRAALTLPRLGAPWRLDSRPTVPTTYGFSTRQYVPAGQDSAGRPQSAQVMSGPLSPRLKSRYTSPENLAPVINAVTLAARKKFFPEGNSARKTAQQTLSVGGLPAQLAAYEITSDGSVTTVVVAAVSTGADLPSIVYMSVPDTKKELLPDVNTVFKAVRTTAG
ncbi:hypothetical protein [Planomonospora sp. ID82291]|uniref:hypothetical protein n=1 Tax=Planomonospora sp. ID82291 TaxID=2738136 RepID=UPI0018C3908D|nr:hypothetical protein [Planomonospora sp. ID82291]MBG0812737.1 hypothetical protein [Planomonospora sp. ID82291]